jgi:hypothetical protein
LNKGKFSSEKKAQAMAEFALALPILLMIIYGVIETGRAVFMYAAVNNASREAARFGSSDCNEPDCTPQYQNCAAIRDRARATGFLLNLPDDQIIIQYDDGLCTTDAKTNGLCSCTPDDVLNNVCSQVDPIPYHDSDNTCDGAVDGSIDPVAGGRILVTVTHPYSMIIPILPFTFTDFTITSARTIPLIFELDR